MRRILAVETATSRQSVAIVEEGRVLARSDEDAAGAHARELIPTIDRLLKETHLSLSEFGAFAVSTGPGSFTGLRVGLATLMGFRAVTGSPMVAVPTLEAMAWNLRGEERPLCPVLKARSGEIYWAVFQWDASGALQRLSDDRVGAPELLANSVPSSIVVFGEGWLANADELRSLLGSRLMEAPPEVMPASAVSVGLAGLVRWHEGRVAGTGVTPRYVQRADAERALERQTSTRRSRRGLVPGQGRLVK